MVVLEDMVVDMVGEQRGLSDGDPGEKAALKSSFFITGDKGSMDLAASSVLINSCYNNYTNKSCHKNNIKDSSFHKQRHNFPPSMSSVSSYSH